MNFQREGGLLLTIYCDNCGAIHEALELFELQHGTPAITAKEPDVRRVLWSLCPKRQEPMFVLDKGQLPTKDPMDNGVESE